MPLVNHYYLHLLRHLHLLQVETAPKHYLIHQHQQSLVGVIRVVNYLDLRLLLDHRRLRRRLIHQVDLRLVIRDHRRLHHLKMLYLKILNYFHHCLHH